MDVEVSVILSPTAKMDVALYHVSPLQVEKIKQSFRDSQYLLTDRIVNGRGLRKIEEYEIVFEFYPSSDHVLATGEKGVIL